MKVWVRILFQDLIGGVVLVGRWVVVVTPTGVLKNKKIEKVTNCSVYILIISVVILKNKKLKKVKNFSVFIPWI